MGARKLNILTSFIPLYMFYIQLYMFCIQLSIIPKTSPSFTLKETSFNAQIYSLYRFPTFSNLITVLLDIVVGFDESNPYGQSNLCHYIVEQS